MVTFGFRWSLGCLFSLQKLSAISSDKRLEIEAFLYHLNCVHCKWITPELVCKEIANQTLSFVQFTEGEWGADEDSAHTWMPLWQTHTSSHHTLFIHASCHFTLFHTHALSMAPIACSILCFGPSASAIITCSSCPKGGSIQIKSAFINCTNEKCRGCKCSVVWPASLCGYS